MISKIGATPEADARFKQSLQAFKQSLSRLKEALAVAETELVR